MRCLLPHSPPPDFKNRSNSQIGIRMWRNARFGLISPRLITRRRVAGEIPPRYAHASLSLRAAGVTIDELSDILSSSRRLLWTNCVLAKLDFNSMTEHTIQHRSS